MKFIFSLLSISCFFLFNNASAQTSIQIDSVIYEKKECYEIGEKITFVVYGHTSGYTPGDSFPVDFHFGDGKVDSRHVILDSNQAFTKTVTTDYFFQSDFGIMARGIAPDGKTATYYFTIPVREVCGNISGAVFYDKDTSCIRNLNKHHLPSHPVYLFQNNICIDTQYTNSEGLYGFDVDTTGIYYVIADSSQFKYSPICPAGGAYIISTFPSPNKNFSFQGGLGHDLSVDLQFNKPTPGSIQKCNILCRNASFVPTDGRLVFYPGPLVQYISSNKTPVSVTPDSIVWDIDSLSVNNSYGVSLDLSLDTNFIPGDSFHLVAEIRSDGTDKNFDDNRAEIKARARMLRITEIESNRTGRCYAIGDSIEYFMEGHCKGCTPQDSPTVNNNFFFTILENSLDTNTGNYSLRIQQKLTSTWTHNPLISIYVPEILPVHISFPPITGFPACNYISGTLFYDKDSNCVKSWGENPIPGVVVKLFRKGQFYGLVAPDITGKYDFILPDSNEYSVEIAGNVYDMNIVCPTAGSYLLDSFPAINKDFALNGGTLYDLSVNVVANRFRPQETSDITLRYQKTGQSPVHSCSVRLSLDPLLTYIKSSMSPDSISGNELFWKALNFSNGSQISITVKTNTNANIGDTICNEAYIELLPNERDSLNNSHTSCVAVVNSYDPNEKTVNPQGMGSAGEVPPNTDFEYTVFFQNTGNDVAYQVKIVDTLDQNLDAESFRVLNASHEVGISLSEGRVLTFNFESIMLPDSHANEPESHGFIQYFVKSKKDLPLGTEIKNTAHIFFDHNPAIVTNTTLNTIQLNTAIGDLQNADFKIYPNPVSDVLTLVFPEKNTTRKIEIIGISGITYYSGQPTDKRFTVDVSSFSPGVYLIRVQDEYSVVTKRVVVN